MRPYDQNNWWVLAIPVGLFIVATTAAFALVARRDVGLGLLPARKSAATAAHYLLRPIGLAWRLQRGTLVAWLAAMLVFGAVFGSLGRQVGGLQNSQVAELFAKLGATGEDFTNVFFAAILALMGAIISAYAVQALMVLRSEEAEGRLEPLMATATARLGWLMSHVVIVVAGSVIIFLFLGTGMGIAYGLAAGDTPGRVATLAAAALVHVPATLVIAGAVVMLIGLTSKWSGVLAWSVYALAMLTGPLGEALSLPGSFRGVSPFSHTPALPSADLILAPLLALLLAAGVITVIGIVAFRRRDLGSARP